MHRLKSLQPQTPFALVGVIYVLTHNGPLFILC